MSRQYYRAEEYETPVLQCPDCGAWVWDESAHDRWHDDLAKLGRTAADEKAVERAISIPYITCTGCRQLFTIEEWRVHVCRNRPRS